MRATSAGASAAQAMRWVIDEARRLGLREVGLSHVMAARPRRAVLRRSWAFAYTGKIDDGEREMVLRSSRPE